METRTRLSWLVFGLTNAVLFGAGIIIVLLVRPLAEHSKYFIPLVVVLSFALAYPIAWWIAPWMRARRERRSSTRQPEI
jgi:hypothetical protein